MIPEISRNQNYDDHCTMTVKMFIMLYYRSVIVARGAREPYVFSVY